MKNNIDPNLQALLKILEQPLHVIVEDVDPEDIKSLKDAGLRASRIANERVFVGSLTPFVITELAENLKGATKIKINPRVPRCQH